MGTLQLIDALLEGLAANRIQYVHWKSNEHLEPALRGETDLDLLVLGEHRDPFEKVLSGLSFVPLASAPARRIPGTASYLGFDPTTGALVHLDVQYRLVLGEQLLKNHHLPVEEWLLDDPSNLDGVRVPKPEQEMLLLYLRAMLKTTSRQLLAARIKGGSPVPHRIVKEARWLAERTDPASLAAAANSSGLDIGGDELAEFRTRVLEDRLDRGYVASRRDSLRKRMARYRRMPAYMALPKKAMLRLRSRPWARSLHIDIPKRRLTGTGVLVAAVGADGSGKSRLTRDLESWLGSKVGVRHVYFGQPKDGILFKALNKPGSLARHRGNAGAWGAIARYTDSLKWVSLARKRRRLASEANSDAAEGQVVIAERYPLHEFHSMPTPMDGPRLQPDRPLAGTELRQYRAIEAPDLTLVLDTDVEVLRGRKLDLTVEEHHQKVEAVRRLQPAPERIVIDAARPYEEVLLIAKTSIWEAIVAGR